MRNKNKLYLVKKGIFVVNRLKKVFAGQIPIGVEAVLL